MKKQITTIALGIVMLSLASAMTIYAGESYSFKTNLTNPVYTVTGNTYNLTGLTIEFEKPNITILTVPNFRPDNFTLIFFDNLTKEITKIIHSSGGGGSSKTKYVDKNVTVYVPEYINNTKEVEKIIKVPVDNMTVLETGFETWHVLLAMAVGGCFIWFVMRKKND